jgi:hypothetical protein
MASRLVSLIFLILMTAITRAQSKEEFICTFGSDNRMVSVVKTDAARAPKACRVNYTRNGRTMVTKLADGHFSYKPQSVGAPDGPEA